MKVTLTPSEQFLIEDVASEHVPTLVERILDARDKKPGAACVAVAVDAMEFDYLRLLLGLKWNGGRPKARRK